MRAKSRRKLEMCRRVLEFIRQHPDSSPGYMAAAARLQELLNRADTLARQQLDGRTDVHAATVRKAELKRLMKTAHLDHLASVAEVAAVEDSEVRQKFQYPADATTYFAFQAVASGMVAEAESRKELLLRHGLSEDVLSGLKVALDQFETAIEQGAAGRLAQVAATAELVAVAEAGVQVVKVMKGLVRIRFGNQPDVLAAWESASNVLATPKPEEKDGSVETPPSGGEVKPAA
jgi:hypothetical protein